MRTEYLTDAVYGISRDVPLNYVTRKHVDDELVGSLTRQKHLVIYGSSKQGKTCLRKHCLKESDYIVVQCSNKWSIEELNANILKRSGFKTSVSEKKTVAGRNKIMASLGASIFGMGATVSSEKENANGTERVFEELEIDPADVNDIIRALESINFCKYIVIEDFHYLTAEVQRDFAIALKAYHEGSSFCFMIIGVWREEDRLSVHNGDLAGRVISIDADKWENEELQQVIQAGADLLNISFDPNFVKVLLGQCYGSVYIVQEACRKACVDEGVLKTQDRLTIIGRNLDANEVVRGVVAQQNGRYTQFITQFSEGFQETQLEMFKWLIYPILHATAEKLDEGFRYRELREALETVHPLGKKLNAGNLTQALQSTAALQVKKNITPIILDYDQTDRRLDIVDRGFISWFINQTRSELVELANLRVSESDEQLPLDMG
jgi:hypothetical protein